MMTRTTTTVAACAATLWATTALAAPTPQQKCDNARIRVWSLYLSCINKVVAKDAKSGFSTFEQEQTAFAKCRHAYFKKWNTLQGPAYATSSCIGSRFTDNGTTVKDKLTSLVWEKKTRDGTVHDSQNLYDWGLVDETGTAFTDFLPAVNAAGFGGSSGWRLPTLAELQTIVLDYPCTGTWGTAKCTCPAITCVDPALDPLNTQEIGYWCTTNYLPDPSLQWSVVFYQGYEFKDTKTVINGVRAVRGGL